MLLADDHSIVRRGLRGLLEAAGLTVVGEAGDGLEAVRLCEELRPDLLILDIGMPALSGIEVAARAQKLDRPPGVIILSVHGDESYIMRALAAWARAYLVKSATDEDLIPAVRAVAAGKPFFSPAVTAGLVEDSVRRLPQRGLTDSYHLLTDREKEVLQLLARLARVQKRHDQQELVAGGGSGVLDARVVLQPDVHGAPTRSVREGAGRQGVRDRIGTMNILLWIVSGL